MLRVLGSECGCVIRDPFVSFHDVPWMGLKYGISDLGRVMLTYRGMDRVKKLPSLLGRGKFGDLSLRDLKYGGVRIGNRFGKMIGVNVTYYTAFDTEGFLGSFLVGLGLELSLRGYPKEGVSGVVAQNFLEGYNGFILVNLVF